MNPHTLAKTNKEKYFETFNELYEHSPWVIENSFEKVKDNEKYDDLKLFHNLLSKTVLEAENRLQNSLIKAHPMLAGQKAMNKQLTEFSTNEQDSAGLNSCNEDEIATFDDLNKRYFEKFEFPFIMAVKESTKEEILNNFRQRINNSLFEERIEALKQINKIAWIRIKDIYEK